MNQLDIDRQCVASTLHGARCSCPGERRFSGVCLCWVHFAAIRDGARPVMHHETRQLMYTTRLHYTPRGVYGR